MDAIKIYGACVMIDPEVKKIIFAKYIAQKMLEYNKDYSGYIVISYDGETYFIDQQRNMIGFPVYEQDSDAMVTGSWSWEYF